ncbi:MAG: TatD family hydrolase [Desulforhopalus sp.]|nr:TatD family hydrolase [Desulforhopalus sp.]
MAREAQRFIGQIIDDFKKSSTQVQKGLSMELIDTHCHIDICQFSSRFEHLVSNAKGVGVGKMVMPGVDRAGWQRIMHLASQDDGLLAAPGLHPMYLAHHRPEHLQELEGLVAGGGLVAIGEIGLDYHVPGLDRNVQQQLFERQLQIAASAGLPVLLHVRKAHDQVLATLRRKAFRHGGIVHAFNGSKQQADQFIQLGFLIAICGTITYDRARRIRKTATELPPEVLVVETDAPDIPLAGHRDEDNLPEHLPEVVAALAALRGEGPEVVARYTTANAKRILRLPD